MYLAPFLIAMTKAYAFFSWGLQVRLWFLTRIRLQKATGRCLTTFSTCSNTALIAYFEVSVHRTNPRS